MRRTLPWLVQRVFALALLMAGLVACAGVQVTDYRYFEPSLTPETFFDGALTAHGVVKNRGGRVTRTFNADIEASWENGIGTLVEDFTFDDGEKQQRIWTLKPDGNGSFTGSAGDVIGSTQLKLAGNSLFMEYVLRIPYGDGTLDLTVDDRMYLTSPNVLINESLMKKFGIRVGSIQLVIIKHDAKL